MNCQYQVIHETITLDATNLAIVAKNNGFLFSVSLVKSLEVDTIPVQSITTPETLELVNLYGATSNTEFVLSHLNEADALTLDKLEQLRLILGTGIFHTAFEKSFNTLSTVEQDSILERFKRAKARTLMTPFSADGDFVKDVSPLNSKLKVYELRIFSPTALRVYFHEGNDKVYVSSVEHKSNADQNSDITRAEKILYRMILTS